jgi:hypothetical protein
MKRTITSIAFLFAAFLGMQQSFAQNSETQGYHYLKTHGLLHGYTNEQLMAMQLEELNNPPVPIQIASPPPVNHIQAPVLVAGPDTTICSGSVTLSATLLAGTGTNLTLGDDQWSPVINLPFPFTFYGNVYNQCIIGSNGEVGFNIASANMYNTWPIGAPVPSINPLDLRNTVMGPWHDLYPPGGGTIRYATVGTAPNRIFVADWCNVAMFSCTFQQCSQQIQLHENGNIVEVHILNKLLCTQWNVGNAIEAVQNMTGTMATVVPGRNFPIQWTATNDGQRFTPNAGSYTVAPITFNPIPLANPLISWYLNGNLIGTGPTITVTPAVTSNYVAQVSGGCGNLVYTDTATVTVGGALSNVTIVPSAAQICAGGSVQLQASAVGAVSYMWSPGVSLSDSTVDNPVASPTTTTTYTVTADNGSGCTGTATVTVTVAGQGPAVNIDPSGGSCNSGVILIGWSGSPVVLTANSIGAVSYAWSTGDTTQAISITTGGIYCVVVTDAQGCTNTDCDTVPAGISVACGHNGDKVILCHVPPGNPGNPQTICVSPSAIPQHLANHIGDCVGPCSLYYPRPVPEIMDMINEKGFYVDVYPNPSSSSFSLHLIVEPDMPVSVSIYDVTGRLVETYTNVTEQTVIGANLPAGTYNAAVIQGENRNMLHLIKNN